MGWEHIGSLQEGRCVCRYHVVGDSGVVRVLRVDCFSVAGQERNESNFMGIKIDSENYMKIMELRHI